MRLKLDENRGRKAVERFREVGHDVHTVVEERLQGAPDDDVYFLRALEEQSPQGQLWSVEPGRIRIWSPTTS